MEMAAMDFYDGDYLAAYRFFLEHFVANVCRHDDQLPVKMSHSEVLECEVIGEVANITLQHLNQRICPPSLQAYLVKLVIDEFKIMFKKQPEEWGYKTHENTFSSLKLMQAVTNKVNEICQRYLDNSRLALLPPPPSIPLPLTSSYAIKNKRRKMEDRSVVLHDLHTMFSIKNDAVVNYYAVFDGHGGQEAAIYCSTHLHQYLVESPHYPADPELALRDAFQTTDSRLIEYSSAQNCGTTAVCALLYDRTLYIAWAGDSQAALIKNGTGIDLTSPHKPKRHDEKQRIEALGGQIIHYGTWRVNGVLNVSRSLGDSKHKPFISAEPEIKKIELDGSEDFLIIASDGFWCSANECVTARLLYEYVVTKDCDPNAVSAFLTNWARQGLSSDNISVIVVYLTPPSEIAAKSYRNPLPPCDMEPGYQQQEQPYDIDYGFAGKQPLLPDQAQDQQQQQQTNGKSDELFAQLGNNSLLETVNGKHRPKPPKYNLDDDDDEEDEEDDDEDDDHEDVEDVDLGPETNVDAVDDAPEDYAKTLASAGLPPNYTDEFAENKLATNGEDDQFSMNKANKRHQNELIPESDNVADSEDSEDEWNFYRPEDKSGAKEEPQEQQQEEEKPESNSDLLLSSSPVIIGQPSKDPALVEKPDQCEEEKESCSPKPNEDEEYEGPEESEECLCDNNRGPASAEPEADEPVTAEYDELVHQAERNDQPELKEPDTDAEATIPEDELPYDQDQPEELLEQPLQREEPQQQLEDYRQEDEPFGKHQEDLEEKFEQPLQREELQQQQFEDHQQDEHFVKQQEDELEQFEQPLLQVKEEQQQFDSEPVQQPDVKTEPQAELFLPEQQLKQSLSDVDDEDMDSHLSPDAAEFVPTAIPPHISSDVISGSPLKQSQKHLKSNKMPTEEKFHEEICHRPSEIDDSMSDYLNGSSNRLSGFVDETQQTIIASGGFLDDSEISSTKAEFGDESNFSVASELQKTTCSNIDCSYTGSERGDFDFVKDAMTTSMTPGDFKAAFEQEPDLNKVHELKDEDLAEIQNGSYEEEEQAEDKIDVETNEDLSKENIELDLQNFAVQQEQNSEVFSAIVEERESDNKDLFMNQRNIEHDLVQPEVTSTQSNDFKPLEEPVYAGSNPFMVNYESNAQFNNDLAKVTEDLHKVELKEQQEQLLFDNENVLKPEESEAVQKDVRDEVMQNPLNLTFGNASAEQKSEEPVLVSPLKEPEVMSSKFQEENLMSQSIEGLNQEPIVKSEQIETSLLGNSEVPAFENATEKSLIENVSEENFERKSINLSESLQEFAVLEKQICPEQLEIKEEVQPQESQILKENLVEEQKDVEEVILAPVVDTKVEIPPVTNEPSAATNGASETPAAVPVAEVAAGAASTFAVAAAAAVLATTAPSKPSAKTAVSKTSKPSATSKVGSKTPTSPTKAGAGPKAGTTATAAKKPALTGTRTAASKPTTGVPAAKTTGSTLSKTTAAASKPLASTATKTRTSTALSAPPKPRASTVGSKIGSLPADKKPLANGDIKSTGSKPLPTPRTTTKLATSSTAPKTGLVKSATGSTTRTNTGVASTTAPKASRPSSASAAPAATKAASATKLSSRSVSSSTSTTTARPKTASTLSTVKSKIGSTAAKSPVTDKQIKETANKQIFSARTTTVSSSVTKTRVSSATSTTSTTAKRTSLTPKAPAVGSALSPAKKPISKTGPSKTTPLKANSKVSSTTKNVTSTATKVVQNGISEQKVTDTTITTTAVTATNIEEDIPKKDVSPIEPITDNQLITAE